MKREGKVVQFRDLGAQYRALKPKIDKAIQDVINSSSFILGTPVTELEIALAEYVGRKHCVTCANGTDALHLSLRAMGIGPGDAVFTSDFTYFASAGCISIVGATPVFVDIDLSTFNMSADALEKQIVRVLEEGKLTPKAIIPVDLFGQPANYSKILPVAEKYGLKVLEDAAQGFGGSIDGKRACSFGDISATSFFPAKPLGCYGDGGAIFTDDSDVADHLRSLRANGRSPSDKYDNREVGFNSRLDTIQAAILFPKLQAFIEYELDDVNAVALQYTNQLKNFVVTPQIVNGSISSWAQYTILLDSLQQREKIQNALKLEGIPSMLYYPRGMHQQGAFRDLSIDSSDYPNTLSATQRVLSLPMHPYLNKSDVDTISKIIINNL